MDTVSWTVKDLFTLILIPGLVWHIFLQHKAIELLTSLHRELGGLRHNVKAEMADISTMKGATLLNGTKLDDIKRWTEPKKE